MCSTSACSEKVVGSFPRCWVSTLSLCLCVFSQGVESIFNSQIVNANKKMFLTDSLVSIMIYFSINGSQTLSQLKKSYIKIAFI